MERKQFIIKYGFPAIFLFSLVLIWEIVPKLLNIAGYILPTPSAIISKMIDFGGLLLPHTWVTFYEVIAGFTLGAIIGIALAIAIVYSTFLKNALYPLIVFTQAVPKIAIAPIFLIWFGYGILPKIIIGFLIVFFPIVINTAAGLMAIEPELMDLIRSLKASGFQVFTKIRLPNSLPYIFTGFKIAMPLAVVGAVIGEFVGSQEGLGYLILVAQHEMNTALAMGCVVLLALMGIGLFALVSVLEKKLMPWHMPEELRTGGA